MTFYYTLTFALAFIPALMLATAIYLRLQASRQRKRLMEWINQPPMTLEAFRAEL